MSHTKSLKTRLRYPASERLTSLTLTCYQREGGEGESDTVVAIGIAQRAVEDENFIHAFLYQVFVASFHQVPSSHARTPLDLFKNDVSCEHWFPVKSK